jgi:hypothetical protein
MTARSPRIIYALRLACRPGQRGIRDLRAFLKRLGRDLDIVVDDAREVGPEDHTQVPELPTVTGADDGMNSSAPKIPF